MCSLRGIAYRPEQKKSKPYFGLDSHNYGRSFFFGWRKWWITISTALFFIYLLKISFFQDIGCTNGSSQTGAIRYSMIMVRGTEAALLYIPCWICRVFLITITMWCVCYTFHLRTHEPCIFLFLMIYFFVCSTHRRLLHYYFLSACF